MYRQSLPSTQASIESAGTWARGIAQAELPGLATVADEVARGLLSAALRRTPLGEQIHVQIDITGEGLHIEVRDPGLPDPTGGFETAELSSVTSSFGASCGPEGHRTWVLLRKQRMAS
ncbi:ATP-binding protein [Spongiactinospora sp. TRM90649]|uniref:ATP-binding protein n=1 Tax=Spongiactinospora sp. TRM90649 TaxID=3031114 RepID=UPI0023F8C897|nr:ATP-binding protein [Spongiactinospora sp. TRM90649]MDF5751942.1 ATP-binding protein [Spongiactinospora sp. TRM90649]